MDCYLFDIDGTLADNQHRIGFIQQEPKDWDGYFAACASDAPIPHVLRLARDLFYARVAIVYVSGRSDVCRADTERWLEEHRAPYGRLYMRTAGDRRPDDVIKPELLQKVIEDGFKPLMVFDDRDRVVAAWRAIGLPCAQVAPGDF